jgi:hypothetical protein
MTITPTTTSSSEMEFPEAPSEFPETTPQGLTPAPTPVPAGSDLSVPRDQLPEQVVNPWTKEVVDLTDPIAIAAAIEEARTFKREQIDPFIAALERVVEVYVSRQGTATLSVGGFKMTAPRKTKYDRDLPAMKAALRSAGVPEDRLNEAIAETIIYTADGSILRQLSSANPDYKAAIDAHTTSTEQPRTVKVERL